MTINEHLTEFGGKPVEDWLPDAATFEPARIHYRLRLEYEDMQADTLWVDRFSAYLDQPNVGQTTGLVVGMWGEAWSAGANNVNAVIEAIVAARGKLPDLKALFLGDIISEETEISWIEQGDIAPLFLAYPALEMLGVRGGNQLRLGKVQHLKLKKLIIQSGGLGRAVVQDAIMADLPELEHLELWLGDDNYGADATPEDLAPLFSGERFPKLSYLGLRDSNIADELAGVVANAPLLKRLRVLDLSLGTLGDDGAAALLKSALIPHLQKLDIHHHFCSEKMITELEKLGIEVDASDRQGEDTWGDEHWRFVAVSE